MCDTRYMITLWHPSVETDKKQVVYKRLEVHSLAIIGRDSARSSRDESDPQRCVPNQQLYPVYNMLAS